MPSVPASGAAVLAGVAGYCAGVLGHLALPELPAYPLVIAAGGGLVLVILVAATAAARAPWPFGAIAHRRAQRAAAWRVPLLVPTLVPLAAALAAAAVGLGHACWRAQQRLADELPARWEGVDLVVTGIVDDLPQLNERSTRFAFAVEHVESPSRATVPSRLSLAWYAPQEAPLRGRRGATVADEAMPPAASDAVPPAHPAPVVHAGERWRLRVRLKRPHGYVNPAGFDLEAWLLARGLRATGTVSDGASRRLDAFAGRPFDYVARARERLRERIVAALPDAPYAGVLVALAIGDQRAIPQAQWTVFNRTGVSHLISISGLHVTAFAAVAGALVLAAVRRVAAITRRLPARKVAVAFGALLATGYVLLAGAEVPAVRTLAMLLVAAAGLWLGRPGTATCIWLWSLAAVLAIDPWAGLAPGFWLSFGAVGLLLLAGAGRLRLPRAPRLRARVAHALGEAAHAQWVVTIGLVPATLALFQQVSLISVVANAFAIPAVTALVVPLALAGIVVPWDGVWRIAHAVLAVLMHALEWLAALPAAMWASHAPGTVALCLAIGGVLLLLAPRAMPGRWLAIAWLAPMLLVLPARPPPGSARAIVLDVGQGTAVLVETATHALVYDTGPRYSDTADAGSRVLVPVLRAAGVRALDALVVSHQDADHSGGALSLLAAVPVGITYSSLPLDHVIVAHAASAGRAVRCSAGQAWSFDEVRFELLHPPPALYDAAAKSNDRSCVLRVAARDASLLLTGDIEARSEAVLLATAPLHADVLLVPHHGSRTSSTTAFIAATRPATAIVTAGYRNRFGHPKPDIVARYRAAHATMLRTDRDGAVSVGLGPGGITVRAERDAHRRYWHDRPSAERG
jgi:competence protein ComEC